MARSVRNLNAVMGGSSSPATTPVSSDHDQSIEADFLRVLKDAEKISASPILPLDATELYDYSFSDEQLFDAIRAGAEYAGWKNEQTTRLIEQLQHSPDQLNNLKHILQSVANAKGIPINSINARPGIASLQPDTCLFAFNSEISKMIENPIKTFAYIEKPEQHTLSQRDILEFLIDHEAGHCNGDPIDSFLKQRLLSTALDSTNFYSQMTQAFAQIIKSESHSDIAFGTRYMLNHDGQTQALETLANLRAMSAILNGDDIHSTQFELDKFLFQKKGGGSAPPYLMPEQVIDATKSVTKYLLPYRLSHPDMEPSEIARRVYKQLKLGLAEDLIINDDGTRDSNGRTVAERYCKAYEYFMPKDALSIRKEIGTPNPEDPIVTNRLGQASNRLGQASKQVRALAPAQ